MDGGFNLGARPLVHGGHEAYGALPRMQTLIRRAALETGSEPWQMKHEISPNNGLYGHAGVQLQSKFQQNLCQKQHFAININPAQLAKQEALASKSNCQYGLSVLAVREKVVKLLAEKRLSFVLLRPFSRW